MKITKAQLRQIIKEELQKELEQEPGMKSGNSKEAALRQIVADKQAGKVDGVMVDLFSASAILSVLDAINEANKEKLLSLPVESMADIAFKMAK